MGGSRDGAQCHGDLHIPLIPSWDLPKVALSIAVSPLRTVAGGACPGSVICVQGCRDRAGSRTSLHDRKTCGIPCKCIFNDPWLVLQHPQQCHHLCSRPPSPSLGEQNCFHGCSEEPEMSSRGTKLLLAGATSPPLWAQAAGRRSPCRRGLSGQDHRAPGRSSTSSQCMEQPVGKIFHLGDETFPSLHSQGGCRAVWFLSNECCSPGQAALSLPWGQEADATLLLAPASSGGSSTSQLRAWNPLTRRNPSLQHSRTGILPRHRRCLSSKRGSEPPLGSSQGNGGWHPQIPAPAAPRASPGPGESGVIPPARVSPEHLG